jgi:hypothetical protein
MKRIVISDRFGGSLPGRPDKNGKQTSVALQKGRNEIEQEDLDAALAHPTARLAFGKTLHVEPLPAAVQPAAPPVAYRGGRATAAETKAAKLEPGTAPETPHAKAEAAKPAK